MALASAGSGSRRQAPTPNAILSVYSAQGSLKFDLTNQGGGWYADQRGWVTNPRQISVRSNFGGSGTATLTSWARDRQAGE